MSYILFNLFKFLRRPILESQIQRTESDKWRDLAILFIVTYALRTVYLFTATSYIRSVFNVDKSSIVNNEQPIITFFFLAVVAYPILEEFIFRYWLARKKILTLVILLAFLLTTTNWLLSKIDYTTIFVRSIILIINSISIIVAVVVGFRKLKVNSKLEEVFCKFFPVLFYMSVFSFGFVHILNYDLTAVGAWGVFLAIPFILSGITLGYVRIKYGMIYNCAMHIGFNLITFILDKGFGL